jgi:hypothetical protein
LDNKLDNKGVTAPMAAAPMAAAAAIAATSI